LFLSLSVLLTKKLFLDLGRNQEICFIFQQDSAPAHRVRKNPVTPTDASVASVARVWRYRNLIITISLLLPGFITPDQWPFNSVDYEATRLLDEDSRCR